jgi:trehalose/maltose hydrolase-like predicted phosphorylase
VKLWQINEDTFNPQTMHSQETVFTVGNGYFGTRGTFEEGYPKALPATLLYGVFDSIDVGKEELANTPDWLLIKLFVNGERFRLDKGHVLDHHRTLDIYTGILTRHLRWESPSGIRLSITSERIASLAEEHVGAIRYTVKAEEDNQQNLDIVLRASLNTAVANYDVMHWESLDQGKDGNTLWLLSQTRHTNVQLVQTLGFTTQTPGFAQELQPSDIAPGILLAGSLAPGASVTTEKIVVMYTSRDTDNPIQAAIDCHKEVIGLAQSETQHASPDEAGSALSTFDALLVSHKAAWRDYWQTSDIIIEGDDRAQLALRYNIYQLRISASTHDSWYSVAAKGLTGFGYRGHVFHDTEIFMLPYYTYVHPTIARNLLLYRYHLLPAARKKARKNGFEGAQYPWESTLDGDEATPDAIIHPESKELIPVLNGSIELHITSSIFYAVWRYWKITGDDEFMQQYGAEMLLSIAKFWGSRAEKHPEYNDYEINNVIGPDEWHEHVDNNAFTNYMAKWSIQHALNILPWLQTVAPAKADQLVQQLDLSANRLDHWRDVAARMRIPQDKETRIFEQFDGFFELKPLDQEQFKGRKTSYQGLLGMEAIQKLRIIKQADVLMLLTLLSDEFDLETKYANWNYYFPITDHDYGSSLTPALHTILACELGYVDDAYELFMKGAWVDLANLRGNTPEGIHDASAGAVWQATVLGFAGLRLYDDGSYSTSPSWPDGWTRIAFSCQHKGELLKIDLRKE